MSARGGPAPATSSFVDVNYRSIADIVGFADTVPEVMFPPSVINDTLKVSNSSLVHVSNKEIYNSSEDCLDLCRVEHSTFENLRLCPSGKNGVTIKGASYGIQIDATLLIHGSECDVELGQFDNYWYPGRLPTSGVSLNFRLECEGPLHIRVWDATEFSCNLPPEKVKITKVPKFVWFPYFLLRYTQLRCANLIRRYRGQSLIKTS